MKKDVFIHKRKIRRRFVGTCMWYCGIPLYRPKLWELRKLQFPSCFISTNIGNNIHILVKSCERVSDIQTWQKNSMWVCLNSINSNTRAATVGCTPLSRKFSRHAVVHSASLVFFQRQGCAQPEDIAPRQSSSYFRTFTSLVPSYEKNKIIIIHS